MNIGLTIAAAGCVVLAAGHGALGAIWVLPFRDARLPDTPFGPQRATAAMLRITWHVVTVFCLGLASLLFALASGRVVDSRALLLRCIAAMFWAVTVVALVVALRTPRALLRLPVPSLWVAIAVLCWTAA